VTSATRSYRGASADERRARRRSALLAAGLELLGTRGWAGTTVRGVCAQAGLNDRYFYESFPDLDALRLAVVDDLAAQGTAAILAATQAPRDLRARTRAVVTAIVDFFTADPRRAHILVHELQSNQLLQDRRRRLIRALVAIFTAQVHEILDEVPVSDTDVELTALTLIGGGWELITAWLRGDLAVDRDHLIDFVVALMVTSTDLAAALDQEPRPGAAGAAGTGRGSAGPPSGPR
jgi:AcrR family transcriptional regulator